MKTETSENGDHSGNFKNGDLKNAHFPHVKRKWQQTVSPKSHDLTGEKMDTIQAFLLDLVTNLLAAYQLNLESSYSRERLIYVDCINFSSRLARRSQTIVINKRREDFGSSHDELKHGGTIFSTMQYLQMSGRIILGCPEQRFCLCVNKLGLTLNVRQQ